MQLYLKNKMLTLNLLVNYRVNLGTKVTKEPQNEGKRYLPMIHLKMKLSCRDLEIFVWWNSSCILEWIVSSNYHSLMLFPLHSLFCFYRVNQGSREVKVKMASQGLQENRYMSESTVLQYYIINIMNFHRSSCLSLELLKRFYNLCY